MKDTAVIDSAAPAEQSTARPKIAVICESGMNLAAAHYAFKVILETGGADVSSFDGFDTGRLNPREFDAVVTYGERAPDILHATHVHVTASRFFEFENYLKRSSLPVDCEDVDGVVSFFPTAAPRSDYGGVQTVRCDLAAGAFLLLTGYEEVVSSGPIDKRGRREAESLMQVRFGLLERPVVTEYSRYLVDIISSANPRLRFPPLRWRGAEFAVAVTRDIDSVRKYPSLTLRQTASLAARGRIREAAASVKRRIESRIRPTKDPHDNLDEIVAWEKEAGIRSSLYVMASDLIGDSNYKVQQLAKVWNAVELHRQGWEIGFHPGFRTFVDSEAFSSEKCELERAFGRIAVGGRQHGLRFSTPHTWRHWEDSGFLYDSTSGFPERPGFKCGICSPFQPFDILENRIMNLWEVPLTVMDCTLDSYCGFDAAASRQAMDRLLSQVMRHNGVFVMLWHNNYFGRSNSGPLHDELVSLVQRSQAGGALVAPLRDLVNIWVNRYGV